MTNDPGALLDINKGNLNKYWSCAGERRRGWPRKGKLPYVQSHLNVIRGIPRLCTSDHCWVLYHIVCYSPLSSRQNFP